MNLVFKSGTNEFHGSGLFLYRTADLQARPSLAAVDPSRTWNDEAFTVGAPIRKDRIFFFGQFENHPYTLPNPITITPANARGTQFAGSRYWQCSLRRNLSHFGCQNGLQAK